MKHLFFLLDKILPLSVMLFICNIVLKLRGINEKFIIEKGKIRISSRVDSEHTIVFNYRSRLPMYLWGIQKRLKQLANDYGVDEGIQNGVQTIVDCGANIGEIGLYLKYNFPHIDYIAFEPGNLEFATLRQNLEPFGTYHNIALWYQEDELEFFEKSETADSSIFEILDYVSKTVVKAKTLDSIDINRNKIFLKVEGEGAEPEILNGALRTLNYCDFISVDCGFERGLEQASTLFEVYDIMKKSGFSPKIINKNRLVISYVRK